MTKSYRAYRVKLFTTHKEWHWNGLLHREDGSAVEYVDGSKSWCIHGKLHREGGPAIEWPNGSKEWYLHGKCHREDGPAVELVSGYKEWWLRDQKYTQEEWKEKVQAMNKINSDTNTQLPVASLPVMEVDKDGTKRWKLNGQLHREDGPAVILDDGSQYWYLHDKLHREDGPASMENPNGDKEWWIHGKLHREDGPAREFTDGTQEWYRHGQRHREDGPAIVTRFGTKSWFLDGQLLSEEEWQKKISAMKTNKPDMTQLGAVVNRQEVWKKFETADIFSDEELNLLLQEVEAALPYLEHRMPHTSLATIDAWRTLDRLRDIKRARQL